MREAHEYKRYRARVRVPLPVGFPRRMWRKWVRLAYWTEYERDWLLKALREEYWVFEARKGAVNRKFEIYGRDSEDEEWEPVSQWRREQLQTALDVADVLLRRGVDRSGIVAERGQPGRRRGSGIGTLVRHLREVEEIKDYGDVLRLLRGSGVDWITEALESWGDNAKERVREANADAVESHRSACPYCIVGLPPGVRSAITRHKRR